jgi:signal transduction histidine kinase
MRLIPRADGRQSQPGDSFGVVMVVDVTELLRAQKRLSRTNDELERRVLERTAQLEQANQVLQERMEQCTSAEQHLRQSRDQLARLSEELIHAQEKERHRTALELHDTVGQALGAVKYTLERFIAIKKDPALGDAEVVLAALVLQLQQAITSTRSLSMSLRPSLLDDMGAASALRWFCRSFAETHSDLDLLIEIPVADSDVPSELAVPVFRIAQEALTNVAKHAAARVALIALRRSSGGLVLEVRDDGTGFDPNFDEWSGSPRLGIAGMRERSSASGGVFTIVAGPEAGTQVRVEWPAKVMALPSQLSAP